MLARSHIAMAWSCGIIEHARTISCRILGELAEGRVDVEDGDLEVSVPSLERLYGGVQLLVEGLGVAVEPRHARVLALAVQPDGRRQAAQRRHGRDADPPRPQPVQLLQHIFDRARFQHEAS